MKIMPKTLLILSFFCASGFLQAAIISVPNYSFESPVTQFAGPQIDSWQQIPEPPDTTSGVFANAPGAGFIDNCDGSQAAFLFANPQIGFFQDNDSIDYTNASPTHAFSAKFEIGKSYDLTVALTTSQAFPLNNGATLQLALYYRDGASNMVVVAATNVAYNSSTFTNTHFLDFQAHLPAVNAADPWAGQHIGISILSTVSALGQGIWDIDNVRLSSSSPPSLLAPGFTNGHFGFTLQSDPGQTFEILASSDASLPRSAWSNLGNLTNVTGTISFSDPSSILGQRFYQAHQLP